MYKTLNLTTRKINSKKFLLERNETREFDNFVRECGVQFFHTCKNKNV